MPSGGSSIVHTNAVRIRAIGVGNMDLQLQGYNDVLLKDLTSVAMTPTNKKELNRTANFSSQATRLKGSTDEIDEVMQVSSIIIFVKELWTDYPA